MLFYIIREDDDKILESMYLCPDDPQEVADLYRCGIYIIRGQHTGLSAQFVDPAAQMQAAGADKLPGIE